MPPSKPVWTSLNMVIFQPVMRLTPDNTKQWPPCRWQTNNNWNYRLVAQPALYKLSAKIRWKTSRLNFLGSRWHLPHWLDSKGQNDQRRLLISASETDGYFEGKIAWNTHQWGLVLAGQFPSSLGPFNPEETGFTGLPMSSHLQIWPHWTTTCSVD
jgi:hypothetical protein